MTYHTKSKDTCAAPHAAVETSLVRSSGSTPPAVDTPGVLTGSNVIPDPIPPAPTNPAHSGGGLVSANDGPDDPKSQNLTSLQGLEPVPGYVPRSDMLPDLESGDVEECRPMPADCQAATGEQEEFILLRRCGMQRPSRPNRSMEAGLERRRLFRRGRGRKFFHGLANRLRNGQGFGSGALFGAIGDALEAGQVGGGLEVVIGTDDRILIDDTTAAPFSGCTQLDVISRDGRGFVGSGTLVARTASASVFLTAAHCVYYHEAGGFARKVTASPGRDGDDFPFGRYVVDPVEGIGEILVPDGWINGRDRNQDWALIVVPEPVQNAQGVAPHVFRYAAYSDSQLVGALGQLSGYPVNLNNPLMDSTLQFYHAERVSGFDDHVLTYDNDTNGGQSGSALYVSNPQDNMRTIIGVHTMGDSMGNSATRITPQIVAQIDGVVHSFS